MAEGMRASGAEAPSRVRFAATHWSVVLAAGQQDSPRAAEALETLCRTYWGPLRDYLRRDGWSEPDAQDLVQGFLAQLLKHQAFGRVAPARGRFRSFLLASLKNYVSDQRAYACRQKRGGGRHLLSLDAEAEEGRSRLEPSDRRTPEQIYERRWVMALLDRTLERLRGEYAAEDRAGLFEALQPFLAAKQGGDRYADLAARLGRSEGAIKKVVQRMRCRYQKLFREELARTVASPEEFEDELRHVCRVMSGG